MGAEKRHNKSRGKNSRQTTTAVSASSVAMIGRDVYGRDKNDIGYRSSYPVCQRDRDRDELWTSEPYLEAIARAVERAESKGKAHGRN